MDGVMPCPEKTEWLAPRVDIQSVVRVVAVAAEDPSGLASTVASHYGRCPFYLVAITKGRHICATRVVSNPFSGGDQPGDMLEFFRSLGADVMLSGAERASATNHLVRFGIEEVAGARGRIEDALNAYLGERGATPHSG
jgi:predicted Fe-Mo cluster-binding NifX family protein